MYSEPSKQTWTCPELSVVLAALVQGRGRVRCSPPKAGQKPLCGVRRGPLQDEDLAGDSLGSWTSLS